jgi:hypothetical protein
MNRQSSRTHREIISLVFTGLTVLAVAAPAGCLWAGDREDVAALVHAFASVGDQSDSKAFRAIFTAKPAIEVGKAGPMEAEAFFAARQKRLDSFREIGSVRRQHITTLQVKTSGSKALATALFLTTTVVDMQPQVVDMGSVQIDAVKTAKGWLISGLRITSDTGRLDFIRYQAEENAR